MAARRRVRAGDRRDQPAAEPDGASVEPVDGAGCPAGRAPRGAVVPVGGEPRRAAGVRARGQPLQRGRRGRRGGVRRHRPVLPAHRAGDRRGQDSAFQLHRLRDRQPGQGVGGGYRGRRGGLVAGAHQRPRYRGAVLPAHPQRVSDGDARHGTAAGAPTPGGCVQPGREPAAAEPLEAGQPGCPSGQRRDCGRRRRWALAGRHGTRPRSRIRIAHALRTGAGDGRRRFREHHRRRRGQVAASGDGGQAHPGDESAVEPHRPPHESVDGAGSGRRGARVGDRGLRGAGLAGGAVAVCELPRRGRRSGRHLAAVPYRRGSRSPDAEPEGVRRLPGDRHGRRGRASSPRSKEISTTAAACCWPPTRRSTRTSKPC